MLARILSVVGDYAATRFSVAGVVRLSVAVFLASIPARAEEPSFLGGFDEGFWPSVSRASYLWPSEHNPGDAAPILKKAPAGVYVSVGFERSFIGASLTPEATHLLILDIDPEIVRFARFNAGLLALARDRADYVHLRLRASHAEILSRLAGSKVPSDLSPLLHQSTDFEAFRKGLASPPEWGGKNGAPAFELLHVPPVAQGHQAFLGANYLYDDAQFAKLSAMAKSGRISAVRCNLSSQSHVDRVVNTLKKQSLRLSVLDASDTWYLDPERGGTFLSSRASLYVWGQFGQVASPESRLLFTSWHRKPPPLIPDARSAPGANVRFWPWIYFGFTYGVVSDKSRRKQLLKGLAREFGAQEAVSPLWMGTLNGVSAESGTFPDTIAGIFEAIAERTEADCAVNYRKILDRLSPGSGP